MSKEKKNLGLRATAETGRELRRIAQGRNQSVQQLFDDTVARLLLEDAPVRPPVSATAPSNSAHWAMRFLGMLPGAAVIKKADDLSVVWVNEFYSKMVHESPEALVGKTVHQIWATRESAKVIEKNDREALHRKSATIEIETVKDLWGHTLERLRIRFPIFNSEGDVEFLGAIGFDSKQLESKLGTALRDSLT